MSTDYKKLFDLTGKTAVVTGGAGILGAHFCKALASNGANVVVGDVNAEAAKRLADDIAATYGTGAISAELDVTSDDSINASLSDAKAAFGSVEILHNNAASKGPKLEKFFDSNKDFSMDVWRDIMKVNVDGMFQTARIFAEEMTARGSGSIIQTASIYGIVAPDQRIYEGSEYMGHEIASPAIYSASKAGVIGLTQYLASYYGAKGVRVNSLTPGGVSSGQNGIFSEKYSARVPMARMAEAHEITGALVFLASDAASYVTGQNIIVDGGLTCW